MLISRTTHSGSFQAIWYETLVKRGSEDMEIKGPLESIQPRTKELKAYIAVQELSQNNLCIS
jgi:hypothetical protein